METWIAQHFLNPAFVAGGAALLLVPIIIHLINRLRFRRVRFAAMEFLFASQKRNRRRILLEQLILLLLRLLMVAGLVALIARFVLDPSEMSLFRGAQSHHVVLLDDSASMRDQFGETTAFDEAVAVIERLAAEGSRRPGTQQFTLLLMSTPDQPLFTQQTVDEQFVVELDTRLEGLKCSHQALSLVGGFEGARNVLIEDRATIRHLHVVSDFREVDWQEQTLSGLVKDLDSAGVTINLVKTVGQRNQNLGITSLTGDVQVASAGVPVRFRVTVKNFGDQVATKAAVALSQDGQRLPLTVNFDRIEADAEVTQEFDLSFDSAGRHRVDVRLPADTLAHDNVRYLAVDIAPVNQVLIVEGVPADDEGDYLADALAADPGITGYSPQLETVDYLRRRPLDDFQTVFMINVGELPPDALAPLEQFVENGGGLVWFLGDSIKPDFYLRELYRDGTGLFPGRISIVSTETQASDADSDPDTEFSNHPAFQVFQGQDNPFSGLMRVYQYFPLAEDWERDDQRRGDAVRTIARLTNREPLILESQFGRGRVVASLTSCGPVWNNWARYPSFVPMMLDLEKHVARQDRVLERRLCGEPVELSLNPADYLDELEIIGPDSTGNRVTRLKAAPAGRAATSTSDVANPDAGTASDADAGAASRPDAAESSAAPVVLLKAVYRDTDEPGIYRVRLTDQSQTPVERWLTFNPSDRESELGLATTEQIRKQLGDNLEIQIHEPGEFSWIAGRDAGQEFRFWLIVTLVIVMFAEQCMAYRLSFHQR